MILQCHDSAVGDVTRHRGVVERVTDQLRLERGRVESVAVTGPVEYAEVNVEEQQVQTRG